MTVMLPFTPDQFFGVFAAYNEAVWPMPIIAYALGGGVVFLAVRSSKAAGWVVPLVLAAMWMWTGIAYHGLYFRPINPAATVFALLFVVQGLLFPAYAVIGHRLAFATTSRLRRQAGFALVAYAMILYPLVGLVAGHVYPSVPTFGVTPCPLTIFTFGMLLLAVEVPRALLIIPLLWSVIGGSAAILLAVPEDGMLSVSGVVAALMLLPKPRRATDDARVD